MKDAEIKPMVNQVERHPRLTQKELQAFCQNNGIQLEAWSPLMQGQLLDNDVLLEIANKHKKSVAPNYFALGLATWDCYHSKINKRAANC
ncbi:diketogulonate reductase-like aldo/keto reductase [Lederbergia galactosidilyticus]|nr:diketogulonate reductase-like aldo/keto reductase [Lederbergia galactosidilytica]